MRIAFWTLPVLCASCVTPAHRVEGPAASLAVVEEAAPETSPLELIQVIDRLAALVEQLESERTELVSFHADRRPSRDRERWIQEPVLHHARGHV